MSGDSLIGKGQIHPWRRSSRLFCRLCKDPIYAENAVYVGEGVVVDEDGSKRADREDVMCPECAFYVTNDSHKAQIAKLDLMAKALAKAEAAGLPQLELEAMAEGWIRRMERDSLEQFRKKLDQDVSLMAKFEGRT